MVASGEVGALLNVDALVWQDWAEQTAGTWRQDPAISGGGFLFDTGAHMLNTVADIAGEEIAEVAAWLVDDGRPVDIRGVVIARLASGALVTMNGVGRAIPSVRLGRPGLLRARDAADRCLGRAPRAPAARGQAPVAGPVRGVADRLAAVPRGPERPGTEPEPTRGRSAHGPAVGRHP